MPAQLRMAPQLSNCGPGLGWVPCRELGKDGQSWHRAPGTNWNVTGGEQKLIRCSATVRRSNLCCSAWQVISPANRLFGMRALFPSSDSTTGLMDARRAANKKIKDLTRVVSLLGTESLPSEDVASWNVHRNEMGAL